MTRWMLTTRRQNYLAVLICLAALAAGCSEGGAAPTEPEPARSRLTLDFSRIAVIEDCDGIEGDGEFEFRVWIVATAHPTLTLYQASHTFGPGGQTQPLGTVSYLVTHGDIVSVYFEATEWDRDIFGNVFPDSRLRFAQDVRSHLFSDGTWTFLGPNTILLGSDGCRVRLNWLATSAAG